MSWQVHILWNGDYGKASSQLRYLSSCSCVCVLSGRLAFAPQQLPGMRPSMLTAMITLQCWCCTAVSRLCLALRIPWTEAHQASLSFTISQFAQTHAHWMMMSNKYLILCDPLLLPPSIFPSIRVFSNESARHIRWLQLQNRSFQWLCRVDFL